MDLESDSSRYGEEDERLVSEAEEETAGREINNRKSCAQNTGSRRRKKR